MDIKGNIMKIQVISLDELKEYQHKDVTISDFSNPRSLDEFVINIIDFDYHRIWEYNGSGPNGISNKQDYPNLKKMIIESKKTKILMLFPQNKSLRYGKGLSYERELKYVLSLVSSIICGEILGFPNALELIFENTDTIVGEEKLPASFYFNANMNVIKASIDSKKPTAIRMGDIYITTLNISRNLSRIFEFLKDIDLLETKQLEPDWFKSIEKFDDANLKEDIKKANEKIDKLKTEVEKKGVKLEKNNHYKSILYTNGEELVSSVFDILEELLVCNLNDFQDVFEEDFFIAKNKIAFVGEIKGITPNVQSNNIGQLEFNVQKYTDKFDEENSELITKGILIINYQRNRAPEKRDAVNRKQIDLAVRYGSLIIPTPDLLDLYEDFKNKKITSEEIIKEFSNQTGLFKRK